jgi:hypothetical protein
MAQEHSLKREGIIMISTLDAFPLPIQDFSDRFYHRFAISITDVGDFPSFISAIHPRTRKELITLMVEPNDESKDFALTALCKKMLELGWTRMTGDVHEFYPDEASLMRGLNGSKHPELTREQCRRLEQAKRQRQKLSKSSSARPVS